MDRGVIDFLAPLFAGEKYGCYDWGSLDEFRDKYPILKGKNHQELIIPKSHGADFSIYLRDMNPDEKEPQEKEDHIGIFIQGEPDLVLSRCTHMLLEGNVVPMETQHKDEINQIIKEFNKTG